MNKKTLWLALVALAGCQPGGTSAGECATPFEKTNLLVNNQLRHYVLVPHFRAGSAACWAKVRGFVQSDDAPAGLDQGVHLLVYLDTTDFALPAGGALGPVASRRVIAQQLYARAAGLNEFTPDPNRTGRYRSR